MDSYEKWTAYLVDPETLLTTWGHRTAAGLTRGHRHREIETICLFTLCLENNEGKRFLIGMQRRGRHSEHVPVNQLFDQRFGEDRDCDVILVPDLGPEGPKKRDIHRFQLTSFIGQADSDTMALVRFLEEKKFSRTPRDDDLFLVVHIEQEMVLEYVRLTMALQLRPGGCPYGQVFVVSEIKDAFPPRWFCAQVYPTYIRFKELDGDTAREVLADRRTRCSP